MNFEITTIPHSAQRYRTVGDWYEVVRVTVEPPKHLMLISISEMGNKDYEFLLGVHELIEAYLATKRGITATQVDSFDLAFRGEGEPGDDPSAPYHHEHQFATQIEMILAEELQVDWDIYNKHLDEVYEL